MVALKLHFWSSRLTTPPVKRSSAGDSWLEIDPNFPIQEMLYLQMVDVPLLCEFTEISLFFLLVFEGTSLTNILGQLINLWKPCMSPGPACDSQCPQGHRIEGGKKTGEDISWTRN